MRYKASLYYQSRGTFTRTLPDRRKGGVLLEGLNEEKGFGKEWVAVRERILELVRR